MPIEEMGAFFDARADIYDEHMLTDLKLDTFYAAAAEFVEPPRPDFRLLDLGCGTGLELRRLYETFPQMRVTGVDVSPEMLKRLRKKLPGKPIELICGSYFDADFNGGFDIALSTYSLHHFSAEAKRGLYQKIHAALLPGGRFVFGDYTVQTQALQDEFLAESARLLSENSVPDGVFLHFDTPFTAENEVRVMQEAGFTCVRLRQTWESASIITAEK